MNMRNVLQILWQPLILLVLIDATRASVIASGMQYFPWALDYAIVTLAFFTLATLSVIYFGRDHFLYTVLGALTLAVINYPLSEAIISIFIGAQMNVIPVIYAGDIFLSVILSGIFSVMIYRIASEMRIRIGIYR